MFFIPGRVHDQEQKQAINKGQTRRNRRFQGFVKAVQSNGGNKLSALVGKCPEFL